MDMFASFVTMTARRLPALGSRSAFLYVGCPQWRGSNTELTFNWCHTGSVFTLWVRKLKAPDQPMRFCFLCDLYWCLLSTYILIYCIWNTRGIYSKKSRYFQTREAVCVSDKCHFVMLSESLLGFFVCFLLFFFEELYNIPTDLMFHWKNIYKF